MRVWLRVMWAYWHTKTPYPNHHRAEQHLTDQAAAQA